MTNKKVAENNRKATAKASAIRKERNDKVDSFSKTLALAGRSDLFLKLADDPDMLLLMKSAVAYVTVSDKVFSKGDMNAETKMGMCFLLGYVIGQSSVKAPESEETKP